MNQLSSSHVHDAPGGTAVWLWMLAEGYMSGTA